MGERGGAELGEQELSKGQAWLALVIMVLALVGLVYGCSVAVGKLGDQIDQHAKAEAAKPPPPLADTLKAADPVVSDVEVAAPQIWVRIYIDSASEGTYLTRAGMAVRSVSREIKKNAARVPSDVQTVSFLLDADIQDRLGNSEREKIMSFSMRASDLKAANYDNLYDAQVLGLAFEGGVSSGVGGRTVDAWCADEKNGARGAEFCRVMLGG